MREPTVVATTMAITVATALATSRVWTAISISPDLTVSKLLKSETYRYPDDADRLRRLLIEAGPRGFSISTRRNVRYWPKADIPSCAAHVCFWGKADMESSTASSAIADMRARNCGVA